VAERAAGSGAEQEHANVQSAVMGHDADPAPGCA